MKNIWLIDIDGTICEDIPNEEAERFVTAKPLDGARERVEALLEQGGRVVYFTARRPEHAVATEKWLDDHGFPRESVIYGKPRIGDGWKYNWIDNKEVEGVYVPGGLGEYYVERGEHARAEWNGKCALMVWSMMFGLFAWLKYSGMM
jgi:hypothetical protein